MFHYFLFAYMPGIIPLSRLIFKNQRQSGKRRQMKVVMAVTVFSCTPQAGALSVWICSGRKGFPWRKLITQQSTMNQTFHVLKRFGPIALAIENEDRSVCRSGEHQAPLRLGIYVSISLLEGRRFVRWCGREKALTILPTPIRKLLLSSRKSVNKICATSGKKPCVLIFL